MKSSDLLKKIKEAGSSIKNKLPKPKKVKKPQIKVRKTVSSGQFTEVIKDKFSKIGPSIKKCFAKLRKFNLARIGLISLLTIVGIYLVGAIVVGYFGYRTSSKTKGDLKVTKRDIWVEKITTIYPLPATIVNGQFISLHEFYQQVGFLKKFNSQVDQSVSTEINDETSLHKRVLDNLVETTLVHQQAVDKKIKVSKADIDAAYKSAADANGGTDKIESVLEKFYGMTKKQFKSLISQQLYNEKVQEKLLTQVHLKHILVTDQTKADAALARIQKGESFETVAKSDSEDTNSKAQGGDLGWISRGDLKDKIDPAFETAVLALKKGATSGIIKTKYGYHIVKLQDKKGTIDKSFSDWIKEVTKKAKIKKFVKS